MTAKERRHVRNLELKIEELERHFRISQSSGIDYFRSLYETRLALRQVYECLHEAISILDATMAQDPAFMKLKSQLSTSGR